jgi:chromosome segregation ATPase
MKRWAVPALAIAVTMASLAGLVVAWREAQRLRQLSGEAQAQAAAWKARALTAEQERDALRAAQAETGEEPSTPKTAKSAITDDPAVRRELLKLMAEKDEKLAAANRELEQLRAQVDELDEKVRKLTEESQRLAASDREAREQLDTAKRLAEALQTEMKGRNVRLSQLELSNQQLRQREEEARQRLARLVKLTEEIDDLNRRREMYLTNILRRYREVTDLYRTLNLQFATPRDGASPANNDLSRVQNAIYQAEDDMRQLQNLNSQVSRLQKDIAAARK